MLKIGEFAKICQVTIKTLRYYADVGLFIPIGVDPINGYRFYSVEQLPRLNRILALKDLGFSLEQISKLLEENLTAIELRRMLEQRKNHLNDQIADVQNQLALVENRLNQIEKEGKMPQYEVILKTITPILVAGKRVIIPENEQVPSILTPAFDDTFNYVSSKPVKIAGPGIAVWYSPINQHTNEEVEAAIQIEKPIEETAEIKVHILPEEYVASVVHQGDFANFMDSYKAIAKWIEDNQYRVTSPFREVYHKWDEKDLSNTTTEVQFPVEKL